LTAARPLRSPQATKTPHTRGPLEQASSPVERRCYRPILGPSGVSVDTGFCAWDFKVRASSEVETNRQLFQQVETERPDGALEHPQLLPA
jgi:hypothetical protein